MKISRIFQSMFLVYMAVLLVFVFTFTGLDRAITVFTEASGFSERKCVVIDAGHGGEDGGATSCTGVLESHMNLQMALRLDDLLHLLGIDTLMIRTTDRAIHTQGETISARKMSDLKERVRIINEMENAILISIHQNTFSDGRYSGAQVFYAEEGEGDILAREMQSVLVQTMNPTSNRKAKKADGIYLMEHIDCTGILVECGFISNPQEEAMLRSDQYQKKLCSVFAATISTFLYT